MRMATVVVLIKEYEDSDGDIRIAVVPTDMEDARAISVPAADLVWVESGDA